MKPLYDDLFVSKQITINDLPAAQKAGIKTIINNRPDGETPLQPTSKSLAKRAGELGIKFYDIPITPGEIRLTDIQAFKAVMRQANTPILAFCRTGTRSTTLWAQSFADQIPIDTIINQAAMAGYDLSPRRDALGTIRSLRLGDNHPTDTIMRKLAPPIRSHKIVIIGGGSAGIATAASLLKRDAKLDIAIIEPKPDHFYQPGWTMVGGGIFAPEKTCRAMKDLIPKSVKWIRASVTHFNPDHNQVIISDGEAIGYEMLVVAPGLQLDFDKIEGLNETLGKNGVTSNYRYDLAPYTWELVKSFTSGTAIFTQPPMPIKCAGAPQKAMYLSADYWLKTGVLNQINVKFCNAGGVIFGVEAFVPALMKYVKKYNVALNFGETLIKVDGETKTAWFDTTTDHGTKTVERKFDFLHVCPPQSAPDFIKQSPLANDAGWVDVDQYSLQHTKYNNIYGLGDACSAPNAKTMAAARKQAPIVAANILEQINQRTGRAHYDGYGACPLTVERGKVVLAEFGYDGKLLPSLPRWVLKGTEPTRAAWFLKDSLLPAVYWNQMLKGKEYFARPHIKNSHSKLM